MYTYVSDTSGKVYLSRDHHIANMPGTVKQNEDFNAEEAAEKLRGAMQGLGTTESEIIDVLKSHSNEQRQEIASVFKQSYGTDLIDELKSELSSDFEKTVVALMTPPRLYDARELNRAVSGAGTDETALIEIMCSRTNEELEQIKEMYQQEYEKSLEEDLDSDTSGDFGRMMISLVTANRASDDCCDEDEAAQDAAELHECGENMWGTDESKFNQVLCRRSFEQLRRTFAMYEEAQGKTIEEVIESEIGGNTQTGYLAIVDCAKGRPKFFAKKLNAAMAGVGTAEDDLIRLIVSRSEVDMEEIEEAFCELKEGTSLAEAVEGECGGDFKRMLLGLL